MGFGADALVDEFCVMIDPKRNAGKVNVERAGLVVQLDCEIWLSALTARVGRQNERHTYQGRFE